jgi:hypothetical protein
MWNKGRYRNPVIGKHFLAALGLMSKVNPVCEIAKGFRFSKAARRPTTIRASDDLSHHLPRGRTDWHAFRREEEPEVIVLNPQRTTTVVLSHSTMKTPAIPKDGGGKCVPSTRGADHIPPCLFGL